MSYKLSKNKFSFLTLSNIHVRQRGLCYSNINPITSHSIHLPDGGGLLFTWSGSLKFSRSNNKLRPVISKSWCHKCSKQNCPMTGGGAVTKRGVFWQMLYPLLGKLVLNWHVTTQASTYKHTQSSLISGSWLDVTLQLPNLLFEKPKTITVSHSRQSREQLLDRLHLPVHISANRD